MSNSFHLALPAGDLQKTEKFYTDILGCKIGNREKISLNTSHDVYVRIEGCTENECKQLLNKITVQGAIPEPLRVSHLLAKSVLTG